MTVSGRRVAWTTWWVLVVLVVVYAVPASQRLSGELHVDNPRFELDPWTVEQPPFPAVLRYVSSLSSVNCRVCFGLVLEAADGRPLRVLNLNALDPRLGEGLLPFVAAGGFELAERILPDAGSDEYLPFVESLPERELAELLHSPVDLSRVHLDRAERLVVGVGFNYAAHRAETDGEDMERFAFAKQVVPTGAYAPLKLGRELHGLAILSDYEIEIGFVTLRDIVLTALPETDEALREQVAFFNANDVSDRWPIIVDGNAGFTRGKSHPGYLPLGPWMVHGRHLGLATSSGGATALRLSLRVIETPSHRDGSWRQDAETTQMIRDPLQILDMLAQIHATSHRPDWDGTRRGIAVERDGRLIFPAGSIVLTGTPAGTAIEAPTAWDRIRLITRAQFSPRRARELFATHSVRHREAMGYLKPGDVVEARIQFLGTQRWTVGAPQQSAH